MKEITTVPTVNYDEKLSLGEAMEKLNIVRSIFLDIRQQYPDQMDDHSLVLDSEHLNTIALCVGVLVPLSVMPSVENQYVAKVNGERTVMDETEELYTQIFEFAVGFKNTDVARTHDGGYIF